MMDETPVDVLDLAAVEAAACDIVMLAAATLRERFAGGIRAEQVEFKDKQQRDPVTAVDRAMEALVRGELRRRYPAHGILGEEGTGDAITSELLWVLDPIDGTANFAAGLPMYGLSLGLLRNGAPIVGAVYVPFWPVDGGAVLSASLGNGARIAGKRIMLDAASFRPGGPVAVPPGLRAMFSVTGELAKRPGEARNLGSIVAELAMVATGGFQYAVFGGPKLWDVAAGALIVREAGGVSLTWEGGRWRPIQRFRVPRGRPGKPPPTLRDWVQPVLVAGPGAASHVGAGLRPHPRPTKAVRWLLKQRKTALELAKKTRARLTGKPLPAAEAKPAGPTSALPQDSSSDSSAR
ncbi:MAG: inositol monophosphatase [Chloroflexi bacterium]|nr:inositol monophosphatase [Chloroflexota bacterium]